MGAALNRSERFESTVRLIIYIAVGHLFAAFIFLLFEVGAKK